MKKIRVFALFAVTLPFGGFASARLPDDVKGFSDSSAGESGDTPPEQGTFAEEPIT